MTDYASASPKAVRELIRAGQITTPTTGMCDGYAQGNLVVLPKELAWDFLLFCQRNPKSCPLLEVADAGSRTFPVFGAGSDIARDIPKYRVYENGVMTGEYTDVSTFFDDPSRELVSFLIGCSFSFESALLEAGVPAEAQAMKAIGYKELVPCVLSGAPVDEAVAAIQQGTRRYAKRQLTWFRHETDIYWVEALAPDALEQLVAYYQS